MSHVDVAPTLRELCGLDAQKSDGLSLVQPPKKRVLVGESLYGNRLYGWAQMSVATDGRFTLVDGGSRLELFDLVLAVAITVAVAISVAIAVGAPDRVPGRGPGEGAGVHGAGGGGRGRAGR